MLAGLADLVFVLVIVFGVHIDAELSAIIIYAIINAVTGILINVLLRYQGKKYAEIENEELCKRYYNKRVKEKKYLSISAWMALKTLQDVLIKGGTTAFSIFGVVYISITGSKNPIQILLTLGTLLLFACFGLMSMNAAYTRFYNIEIPYMKTKISEREAALAASVDALKDVEEDPNETTEISVENTEQLKEDTTDAQV